MRLILTIEEREDGMVETSLRTEEPQPCTAAEKETLDQINEVLGTVCGKTICHSQYFKDVPRSGP